MKMLRAARHAVAWIPVFKSVGVSFLQVSLRLRGAGVIIDLDKNVATGSKALNPTYLAD